MKIVLPLILCGAVLSGCMETQASSALRAPSSEPITTAPESIKQRARLVADKFGASERFFELMIDHGVLMRSNPERVSRCQELERNTRTAAALEAITLDEQDQIYVCAGLLG